MPSNKRFDNHRDRGQDYSGQQRGYRSGQMGQFEDTGSSSQADWSTGEDYPSRRQMGGSGGAGYDRDEPSRFQNRDGDDYRYGQDQFHEPDFSAQPNPYRSSITGYQPYSSGYSGDYRTSGAQWSQNNYDGRNLSSPYGANYSQQSAHDDFGSWREYGERRGFFDRASDEIASWFGDEDASRRREQDHRGRGPSNYTRSDERIQEDANEHLTKDWRVDASNVTVKVNKGEVILEGHVPTRHAKRWAEDCVEDVSGVKHVQNNLRVQATGPYGSSASSASVSGSSFGSSTGSSGHNLTSTSGSDGTGNVTTGVGTTAPGATGSTGSTGANNKS